MATYTLTTNINGDNLVGTPDNDTFNATYDAAATDTFSANDSLDGGIGIDTLHLDHLQNVAITPPDTLWTNLRNIENVVINTTGDGAQTITTGVNFQAAFAPLGVGLTTRTSGAGAIDITMTTFTGAATLGTTSTAGAQNIVTGSGATTVAAISDAGALNIKGVGLNTVSATTTGAGAQTIGDGSGNGGQLAVVRATSAGGAQTITSTSTSAVVVEATSAAGKQIITTGSGADIITASTTSAANTIDTGAGNDTVTILPTTSGDYTVNGGAGNDIITGGAGNDILVGDIGNDSLDGGAGVDNMTGGDGNDVYYIDIDTDVVTETNALASTGGIDTVNSSLAAYTLGANLENLTLTGTAAINGTGNSLNNTITGNTANNTLTSGAGNDVLNGSTGADTMIGGVGNDTYYVDNAGDITTEAFNQGTDTVFASLTWTLADNLENLTLTGPAAINGTGNSLNNTITGNTANNTLAGGAGNDVINGNTGADTLIGGLGDDTYYVDNAGDITTEALNQGTDTVFASLTWTLADNLENLTLTGPAAININGTGNALDNTITGNTAANTLTGGAGNDVLNGNIGADTLIGGLGDDIYYVDNAGDITTEALSQGTDTVSASLTWTLADNLENLTLTGTAAINGTGNALNNTIKGNAANNTFNGGDGDDTIDGAAGDDVLLGGNGNDVLLGGSGNDSLTGGGGSDRFLYNTNTAFTTATVGVDTITDFISGTDKFILDKTTFTAISSAVGTGFSLPSEFALVGSDTAATTSSADIIYNSANGKLFYNTDGAASGFGAGGQFAVISGFPTISASDFIIQA